MAVTAKQTKKIQHPLFVSLETGLSREAPRIAAPGPTEVPKDVHLAMSRHQWDHMNHNFISSILDPVLEGLGEVWGAPSFPARVLRAGSGTDGTEFLLENTLALGEKLLVVNTGEFSRRLCLQGRAKGFKVEAHDVPWDCNLDLEGISKLVQANRDARAIFLVHVETGNSRLVDIAAISKVVREIAPEMFILVDTVSSFAGIPIDLEQVADAATFGVQKCCNLPVGMFGAIFGPRLCDHIDSRAEDAPVRTWGQDLTKMLEYQRKSGNKEGVRPYHTTAPTHMIVGMAAVMKSLFDEGLSHAYARHRLCAEAYWVGLEAMGLKRLLPEGQSSPTVIQFRLPDGVIAPDFLSSCLKVGNVRFAAGIGTGVVQTIRIGNMGWAASSFDLPKNLKAIFDALPGVLQYKGPSWAEVEAKVVAAHQPHQGNGE